jgi:hypothetical protein
VLLSTDEPLPNPWILEWDGIRKRDAHASSELEDLLMLDDAATRGSHFTPANWSIERVIYESIAPRKSSKRPAR